MILDYFCNFKSQMKWKNVLFLLSPVFRWSLQSDRPYASEGPKAASLLGGNWEPCLAAGGRPISSHQIQHSPGLPQEPVRGGTQQHYPAHGARRHCWPRGYNWVSCYVFHLIYHRYKLQTVYCSTFIFPKMFWQNSSFFPWWFKAGPTFTKMHKLHLMLIPKDVSFRKVKTSRADLHLYDHCLSCLTTVHTVC